jgi:hypothetical protein
MKDLLKLLTQTATLRHSNGLPFRVEICDVKTAFGRVDVQVFSCGYPSEKAWVSLDSLALHSETLAKLFSVRHCKLVNGQ